MEDRPEPHADEPPPGSGSPPGSAPPPGSGLRPGSEPPPGGPRASDADRNRFASMLERHFAEGTLSEEEFSERMDRVLLARTLGELYALSSDLPDHPAVDVPRPAQGQKRRAWRFWRS